MSDQWKLVPVEPTEEMLAAARPAYSSNIQASNTANRDKYQRMLAAALTQGADARPVAISEVERKAIAKSVFGGINALRWILNITTEFDRKDVRTRQAARLLDDHCTGEGTTNRAHLEHLWKTLNDALSLEDTLECLATRDAAPSDGPEIPWSKVMELAEKHGKGWSQYSGWAFLNDDNLFAFAKAIAASAPREET